MSGLSSQGAKLYIGTSSGVAIAKITSISGPSLSMETLDLTDLDVTGGYRDFTYSFKDGGEVTLGLYYDPSAASHGVGGGLLSLYDAQVLQAYTLVFTDAGTTEWHFSAYITQLSPNIAVGEAITGSVTFKIVGQPTFS